jgi:HPt (histidine-containing phosphotransfer) domain-containing protein
MSTPDQSALPADPAISKALDAMWARHRAQILERVAVLEAAANALVANRLTATDRATAHSAAHKLAGTLGMFNLMRGTELARELEQTYAQQTSPPAALGKHLATLAAELRTMIEHRKQSS